MNILNKIRKLREKKGFTLVELIVVIAIIAILTAVLVPLIGNWTQQAAYTTLQDGAQTISNTTNEAISKVMMGGAPISINVVTGKKTGTKLVVSVYKLNATDSALNTAIKTSDDTDDSAEAKTAREIKSMLEATMSDGSSFIATLKAGAVDGVVYSTDSTHDATAQYNVAVTTEGNFDNAFQMGTKPVGASGKYITKKAADGSAGTATIKIA